MDLFLIVIGVTWIFLASLQDLKKREVYNWLNFSLIIIALAYRGIYSAVTSDYLFFVYGLAGFGIFVVLAYGFYYARVFAGGDAKLLMALGAVIPYNSFEWSLLSMAVFIFFLLFAGSLWGLMYSFGLVFRNRQNFSREFKKQAYKNKKIIYILAGISILLLSLPVIFHEQILIVIPVIIFLFPLLYVYGKAIENSAMIKEVYSNKLTEGDWLYESVKVGKTVIKPYWEGLSRRELEILRKYKNKVKIKEGIPFVPSFFFAFLGLILWNYYGILM